jgi:hypothetical protein
MHQQKRVDWVPSDQEKEEAKERGVPVANLRPTETYRKGDVFEGPKDRQGKEVDLVQRFGGEKFEYVDGGRPRQIDVDEAYPKADEEQKRGDPTIFAGRDRPGYRHPGGQVVEGFQGTEETEGGTKVTGLKQEPAESKKQVGAGHEAPPGSAPLKGSAPVGSTTTSGGEAPKLSEAQKGRR